MSAPNPSSSEDARQRAEFHRQQISETLDQLGVRINDTMQSAERQLNKPANLVRAYPLAALGASVALGFLVAAISTGRKRRRENVAERLANAYFEGRRDEEDERSLRQVKYWQEPATHARPRPFHSTFFGLAMPIIRSIGTSWAQLMFDRRFGR